MNAIFKQNWTSELLIALKIDGLLLLMISRFSPKSFLTSIKMNGFLPCIAEFKMYNTFPLQLIWFRYGFQRTKFLLTNSRCQTLSAT